MSNEQKKSILETIKRATEIMKNPNAIKPCIISDPYQILLCLLLGYDCYPVQNAEVNDV